MLADEGIGLGITVLRQKFFQGHAGASLVFGVSV